MARAADQFRSSDVTFWGLAALVAWGVAVFAANVSGIVPASVFGVLHASRLDGGTVNQVRTELADLRIETARMRRENSLLLQRFDLAEQARSEVTRRVGALEVSVPRILEGQPAPTPVDSSLTASVIDGTTLSFEADGGSVRVQQRPLVPMRQAVQAPVSLAGDAPEVRPSGEFGVALGFPIHVEEAEAQWQNLLANVGTLLIGLWPVTADLEGSDGRMVIAGPIATRTDAETLCGRMSTVGIPCKPVPFEGDPLPLLN